MAEKAAALAVPAKRTWNICMLAHVDHGKSALSDCLISSNGIISERSAGKMRYMDSREDEQLRGITMKSSSIALGHRESENSELKVVHLVDSPGHVDFSGEVEAALRVCDGACLVVDVVEGVCVQTVTVLRAALEHAVTPVLVLNKVDRLFTELMLSPGEAYRHIWNVIEQVNVVMGVREVEQMMESATLEDADWTFEDAGEQAISGFFSPETGNVVFASAIHGWAFRISDFARIFSKRFGISERVLQKTLWGDYYLHMKNKRIVRKGRGEVSAKSEPMFARFVLGSVASVYDAVSSTQNDQTEALKKRTHIAEKLELKINLRDLRHRDPDIALRAIMGTWLPASKALMETITQKLPTAKEAQANPERLGVIWPHAAGGNAVHRKEAFERQHQALRNCSVQSDSNSPIIAVVTKMIDNPMLAQEMERRVSQPKPRGKMEASKTSETEGGVSADAGGEAGDETKLGMIGFARLLSGTLNVGAELYVYGPKYYVAEDGTYDDATVSKAKVTSLHLLMGRSANNLTSANAGCIVGIGGLHDAVLKTATLSTEPPGSCLPVIVAAKLQLDSVVRVAVEPHLPYQMQRLKEGLHKLNQSDPAVETMVTSRGEYIIAASGELHLERCLKDLRERFAVGVKIHVSKPLVAFRETVVGGISPYVAEDNAEVDEEGDERKAKVLPASDIVAPPFAAPGMHAFGRVVQVKGVALSLRMVAAPIPVHLSNALDKYGAAMRAAMQTKTTNLKAAEIRDALLEAIEKDASELQSNNVEPRAFVNHWSREVLPRVWSCGPNGFGPNILVGRAASDAAADRLVRIFSGAKSVDAVRETRSRVTELESKIMTGFQLGVQSGPLAEEPMRGVAIFVDLVCEDGDDAEATSSGAIMGLAKDCVRKAVLNGNARIMEGMLQVDISVTNEMLGGTYTVIGKRRGRVLDEQLRDAVNVFGITALVPVVESHGFTDELRKQTSGFAVPQMTFAHWETVDIDPFWEPRTEEELEELGAADNTAEMNNLARKLVNAVRRRKGLRVEEKIVEKAEKQRTLSRKK